MIMRTEVHSPEGISVVFSSQDMEEFSAMIYSETSQDVVGAWIDSILVVAPTSDVNLVYMGHIDFCKDETLKAMLSKLGGNYFMIYTVTQKPDVTLLNMTFKPIIYN